MGMPERVPLFCRDALVAELRALLDGLSLALYWCKKLLMVETDCLEIVKLINNNEVDRSVYTTMI
jgi:hypothetical protein